MKYALLILLITFSLTSCIPIYFHRKFTYKADGRLTGIDKHLKINGSFVSDSFVSHAREDWRLLSIEQVYLYADGTYNTANLHFTTSDLLNDYLQTNLYRHMRRYAKWGQCRVVGDTLFAQKIVPKAIFLYYVVRLDTFIIRADTLLEQVGEDSYGRTKSLFHFRPSSVKLDSSGRLLSDQNWYWTKEYKDSVHHRGAYRHAK